ncbi:hypothetical protein R9C00_08470 [Flammeovirgaceae bacterium SG7u.111]|nr:hypothetical protein [Flammeovirgaceae bacterium SG7u.132]WPO37481.1 hypothetical protein R9C00_08470 [Flammeovirgaceae bacterium SG7u.111]
METKKLILACTLVLLVIAQSSAKNKIRWTSGSVMTTEHQYYNGKVFYDYEKKVFLYQKDDSNIQTFTPSMVSYFSFFDAELEIIRDYVSVEMDGEEGYQTKTFLEIVGDHELTLLRQEKSKKKYEIMDPGTEAEFLLHAKNFDYYVFVSGKFVEANQFIEKVYPLLHKKLDKDFSNLLTKDNLNNNMLSTVSFFLSYFERILEKEPNQQKIFTRKSR